MQANKSWASQSYCFAYLSRPGIRLLASWSLLSHLWQDVFSRHFAIRGGPIRVRRVVVGVARGVHIPRVVSVAAIRRPQAHVLGTAYAPDVIRLCALRL